MHRHNRKPAMATITPQHCTPSSPSLPRGDAKCSLPNISASLVSENLDKVIGLPSNQEVDHVLGHFRRGTINIKSPEWLDDDGGVQITESSLDITDDPTDNMTLCDGLGALSVGFRSCANGKGKEEKGIWAFGDGRERTQEHHEHGIGIERGAIPSTYGDQIFGVGSSNLQSPFLNTTRNDNLEAIPARAMNINYTNTPNLGIPAIQGTVSTQSRYSPWSSVFPYGPQQAIPEGYFPLPPHFNLSAIRQRARTDYSKMFSVSGLPKEFGVDHFGYTILPNSRGAFIKPIPPWATVETICSNIRGGALERVDFHDMEGRTCVGIFFICAQEAMMFIKYCKRTGGIYWAGSSIASKVEAIPRCKGGHEPIKPNVSKGIRSGATRILRIGGLPNNIDLRLLKAQIKNQSRAVVAEIEKIQLVPENATINPTYTGFISMATIGTALGARLKLRALRYYADCTFDFVPDPCERSLEELKPIWDAERYWDSIAQTRFGHFPHLMA